MNIPNVDDLVLGKIVASYVGQWNVPLQHGRHWKSPGSDPCPLMSLVLHVFAEPLFWRVVAKMCNLPGSTRLAVKQAMMKTQYQSASLALQLDSGEASQWGLLGFEDYSLDQCGA